MDYDDGSPGANSGLVALGASIYGGLIAWQFLSVMINAGFAALALAVTVVQLLLIVPAFTLIDRRNALKTYAGWLIIATGLVGMLTAMTPLAAQPEDSIDAQLLKLSEEEGQRELLELDLRYAGSDDEDDMKDYREEREDIEDSLSKKRKKEIQRERQTLKAERSLIRFDREIRTNNLRASTLRYAGAMLGLLLILLAAVRED